MRWDHRSDRRQGKKPFDKGNIEAFEAAIDAKLKDIIEDLEGDVSLLDLFPKSGKVGNIEVMGGSCLEVLPKLPAQSFDALITSPPYCNRYDYTRTYALELALLGIDEAGIRNLRQAMISCTVENRDKQGLLELFNDRHFERAQRTFESQSCLHDILAYLEQRNEAVLLNNPGIVRMVRNYFWEMTLVIFEWARVLKPSAPLVIVNDNVRYDGATSRLT